MELVRKAPRYCPTAHILAGLWSPVTVPFDSNVDNAAFFHTVLPGREEPLGSPGGAQAIGRVGIDTPLVASMPPKSSTPH